MGSSGKCCRNCRWNSRSRPRSWWRFRWRGQLAEAIPPEIRSSACLWFDDTVDDHFGDGIPVQSLVTSVEPISQRYDIAEPPIILEPGLPLRVLGRSSVDPKYVWVEPQGGAHSGA